MISIVTFKWKRIVEGHQLPYAVENYSSLHVNVLYKAIQRNTTIPHRFICVTDDSKGLHPSIEVVNLWDKCRFLGGCYNRLYIFSKDMKDILGERFVAIDIDTVITSSIDSILSRKEDFIINEYNRNINKFASKQYYNGSLIMMNAGARSDVWDKFDYTESVRETSLRKSSKEYGGHRSDSVELVGSDQAWISHFLGEGEATFTNEDGVYDYRHFHDRNTLPENAKIVFFPGKRDPFTERRKVAWIRKHWVKTEYDKDDDIELLKAQFAEMMGRPKYKGMTQREKDKLYIRFMKRRRYL